jgi:cell division protein FtsB
VNGDGVNGDAEPGDEPVERPPRRGGWERPTRIAIASLAVIAIMFLFVFPTRSYLAQQRQVRNARHQVEVLKAQNKILGDEARQLQMPSEIERLARIQFNMVLPGEQAYNVVPPAKPAAATASP